MSEEAAGRLRPAKKVRADRPIPEPQSDLLRRLRAERNGNGHAPAVADENLPPAMTATTTPAGIAANDPEASPPARRRYGGQSPAALGMEVAPPIGKIEPHPANPRLAYPEEEIASLAASIEEQGLLQPITVRVHPDAAKAKGGYYQIVFGHRRYLACRKLKLGGMACRVVRMSDAEVLAAMATENAQREDLNPIETAKMLVDLVKPVDQGGAGMTPAAAAATCGKSESWAVNTMRLLKLPEPWRGRVISREIDETKARCLLPFVDVKPLMKAFDERWKDGYRPLRVRNREDFQELVDDIVFEETDQVDPKDKRLADPKVREHLGIVKIPVRAWRGDKAKIEERITNTELWEKMRSEARSAKEEKDEARATKSKRVSPAMVKARAAEKARQHAKRVEHWLRAFKRFWLSHNLDDTNGVFQLPIFLAGHQGNQSYLRDAVEAAVHGRRKNAWGRSLSWNVVQKLENPLQSLVDLCREFLWPSTDEAYHVDEFKVSPNVVDGLCEQAHFDVTKAWEDAQKDKPAGAGALFEKFFELHSKDQLVALGKELGVHIAENLSKSQAVKHFVGLPRTLKLPAVLKERKKRGAK